MYNQALQQRLSNALFKFLSLHGFMTNVCNLTLLKIPIKMQKSICKTEHIK